MHHFDRMNILKLSDDLEWRVKNGKESLFFEGKDCRKFRRGQTQTKGATGRQTRKRDKNPEGSSKHERQERV